jgi:hypothetical protein
VAGKLSPQSLVVPTTIVRCGWVCEKEASTFHRSGIPMVEGKEVLAVIKSIESPKIPIRK